jgi:hypothetical protein
MSTISAGYDLFETIEEGANFTFPNGLRIPAGFFDTDSVPFMGIIQFRGVPIRKFTDPRSGTTFETGTADTIVFRKQDAIINGTSGSATIEIELARLSLRSSSPIEVKVGRHVQRWDVHVSLSRSVPSTGTMTITQTSASGGHFSSTLLPVPHFRFERLSDGKESHLDTGAMPIPNEKRALVTRINTLESSDVAWGVRPAAPETALAIPELTGNFAVLEPIVHVGVHPVVKAASLV